MRGLVCNVGLIFSLTFAFYAAKCNCQMYPSAEIWDLAGRTFLKNLGEPNVVILYQGGKSGMVLGGTEDVKPGTSLEVQSMPRLDAVASPLVVAEGRRVDIWLDRGCGKSFLLSPELTLHMWMMPHYGHLTLTLPGESTTNYSALMMYEGAKVEVGYLGLSLYPYSASLKINWAPRGYTPGNVDYFLIALNEQNEFLKVFTVKNMRKNPLIYLPRISYHAEDVFTAPFNQIPNNPKMDLETLKAHMREMKFVLCSSDGKTCKGVDGFSPGVDSPRGARGVELSASRRACNNIQVPAEGVSPSDAKENLVENSKAVAKKHVTWGPSYTAVDPNKRAVQHPSRSKPSGSKPSGSSSRSSSLRRDCRPNVTCKIPEWPEVLSYENRRSNVNFSKYESKEAFE